MGVADDAVDQRYGNLYARLAGYLPEDRAAVDEWQEGFLLDVADSPRPPSRAVRELEQLIRHDPVVRMYVTEMLAGAKAPGRTVRTIPELLRALDAVTVTAPAYNPDRKKRVAFPMSALFVRMMMTTAGEALFRQEKFNRGLQRILKEWCTYLDGPDSRSVLNEGPDGWLSPDAAREFNLDDFEVDKGRPHWGFASYNAYFHRQIRPEKRPVDLDPDVVVSANDGTVWQTGTDVREYDEFWVKGQPYSLRDMLNGSVHTADFIGGSVFQSFLSGADYHRWRSPVAGRVLSAEVVDGLMFSNAESAGRDEDAGVLSQAYQSSVNTRGLVFIEADDPRIGKVCVMPVGITEISSVTIEVEAGRRVEKGTELGYFSYGGSSLCLVFQPGTVEFPAGMVKGTPIRVNAQLARVIRS